jgi:membrane-associated phospholipid phosphatase
MIKQTLFQLVNWVRKFIREKFHSENEDLPYYVTILISGIVFIIGLNGFVELTEELAENELNSFDEGISAFIISFRNEWLTDYFTFATHLGDRNAYIVFTILLAGYYLIKHRSWKFIIQTTLVLMLASLSNMVLKKVINRARPSLEHLVSVNTLSYPSGHSMSAMAFYGFLIFLCMRYAMRRWVRTLFITILVLLILFTGISRIYLGVHYPSDVAAGFIGGLIWVAFCAVVFSLIDLLRKRGREKVEN